MPSDGAGGVVKEGEGGRVEGGGMERCMGWERGMGCGFRASRGLITARGAAAEVYFCSAWWFCYGYSAATQTQMQATQAQAEDAAVDSTIIGRN